MRVRIKKGVRPFGGRVFEVLRRGTYSDGSGWVEVNVRRWPAARVYRAEAVESVECQARVSRSDLPCDNMAQPDKPFCKIHDPHRGPARPGARALAPARRPAGGARCLSNRIEPTSFANSTS